MIGPSSDPSFPRALIESIPHLISDHVQLLSLEIRRATKAFAIVMACMLRCAVCVANAGIALWVGTSVMLVDVGFSRNVVAVVVMPVNILLAAALWWGRSFVHLIALPVTVHQLTLSQSTTDDVSINSTRGVSPLHKKSGHEAR